jgi:hypothetical protein
MAWSMPWARKAVTPAGPDLDADDAWQRHVTALAAHGIPEPGSALNGAGAGRPPRPTCRRSTASRRRSRTCCPGWSTCPTPRACCWKTASRWRPSSSWRRSAPRAARWPGCGRRAMRWRTRCRTRSTNSTRTPGWCSSTPRTKQLGQLPALPGELRAAARPGQRLHRVLPALLRPSPACHRQARRPVRGHDGDAPAVARPGAARAHGGLPAHAPRPAPRRGQSPEQALTTICDRLVGGLANAGVKARRWRGRHPRLAAALVQPASHDARRRAPRTGSASTR